MHFTHDCTLVLYTQLIQTGSVLMLLPFSTELGFTLHRDTANGRAATHQLYSFAIEFGLAPMLYTTAFIVHCTLNTTAYTKLFTLLHFVAYIQTCFPFCMPSTPSKTTSGSGCPPVARQTSSTVSPSTTSTCLTSLPPPSYRKMAVNNVVFTSHCRHTRHGETLRLKTKIRNHQETKKQLETQDSKTKERRHNKQLEHQYTVKPSNQIPRYLS